MVKCFSAITSFPSTNLVGSCLKQFRLRREILKQPAPVPLISVSVQGLQLSMATCGYPFSLAIFTCTPSSHTSPSNRMSRHRPLEREEHALCKYTSRVRPEISLLSRTLGRRCRQHRAPPSSFAN